MHANEAKHLTGSAGVTNESPKSRGILSKQRSTRKTSNQGSTPQILCWWIKLRENLPRPTNQIKTLRRHIQPSMLEVVSCILKNRAAIIP